MANTLTGLIPTLYNALDVVSRELVGMIPAVARDSNAERAAVGQDVTYHVAPPATTFDITPGTSAPNNGDQNIGTDSMKITKAKAAPVRWNGEEQLAVGHTGQYNVILRDQFVQAMRALVNEVETDLAGLYVHASRAVGDAGTAPFGTAGDFSDFASALQVLDDNGAPITDRQLVLGSAAMANIRGKQSVLFKANEAGTDELLRNGIIARVEGFDVHSSGGIRKHTKGTGADYVTDGSTAVGVSDIALVTGTGTVVAGDVVTFDADPDHKYVVGKGVTAPGTISLNKPGARIVIPTGNAMTIGNSYAANLAFHRSAIHLVTRAPAMPEGGDAADDVMEIVDPVSGLAFQIAIYREYRQVRYEVGLAWGVKAAKSEHIVLLMG